jgi:diguanylate cyclase (GGDEF)-like protein
VDAKRRKVLVFDDLQGGEKYVVYEGEPPLADAPSLSLTPVVTPEPQEQPTVEFQVTDFFDLNSDLSQQETEPRAEFDFLLTKVLAVIKEVLFAHTVAFFWANRDKQMMVCETKLTDSDVFMKERRYSIGQDLVSQIAQTGKPEVISRVNPISEKELLRYYEGVDFVKAFIGAPVFFGTASGEQTVVGVLAVDSKAEDAYGVETLSLMGQCTKLISALIKSYTAKYDLLLDSEVLSSVRRMQERWKLDLSVRSIVDGIADEVQKLVNFDFLSITLYDEQQHSWIIRKVVNRTPEGYIITNQVIDFAVSIVGSVIQHSQLRQIDDLEAENAVRFVSGEKTRNEGSFLSVPINSTNKCYGAVSVESRTKRNFGQKDAEILMRLAENTAAALEILYLNEIVKEYVIVDESTRSLTRKQFIQILDQELARADDFGTDLCLMVVAVDSMNELISRYGKDGFDFVLYSVAKVLRRSVRPYDVVGRLDFNRFGLLLVQTTPNEAYLWAEKIRKAIAGTILTVDEKKISVTISAGICGHGEHMDRDEFIQNATQVLQKCIETGGNIVRVF